MGLDVFNVSLISKKIHRQVVELYNCQDNELIIYGSEGFIFVHGIDQSSWDLLVRVVAPNKYKEKEKEMATFLLNYLQKIVIHRTVEFIYYDEKNRYQVIDKDYPRFITEANQVKVDAPIDSKKGCKGDYCSDDDN
jgi:hypothetical protein